MSKKEGVLEFVPPRFSLDDVGGYETLKTWLRKRQAIFSKEALDAAGTGAADAMVETFQQLDDLLVALGTNVGQS